MAINAPDINIQNTIIHSSHSMPYCMNEALPLGDFTYLIFFILCYFMIYTETTIVNFSM